MTARYDSSRSRRAARFGGSRLPLLAVVLTVGVLACTSPEPRAQPATTPLHERPASADGYFKLADSLRGTLFPDGVAAGTDTARAYPFVRVVQAFAERYPEHPSVPGLLMSAAGVANGTGWANKSIQLWGYVWRRTPEHPRAAEALFYQGFVMDTRYGDYPQAVAYYDRLLELYPQSEFAQQARGLREVARAGGKLPPVPTHPDGK